MKKIPKLFLFLTLFIIVNTVNGQTDNVMYAHYINVGQGASVLLEFPCGVILIDAGAQDKAYHKGLMEYLADFFTKRKDLHNTIDLIMITHPHIDHNEALRDIDTTFHVKKYIDDGLRVGSGKANQIWTQDNADRLGIIYKTYSFENLTKDGNTDGATDTVIDPINCSNGDPKIILYSGRLEAKPSNWTATDFTNYNNQSLVIKVVFGQASFLFTGDLEEKGIKNIITEYKGTDALDADILMVGHHGAANATTDEYLKAVTPTHAVISCGKWNFGKGLRNQFTTYAYGHPRISTINMLENEITGKQSKVKHVKAATGSKVFKYIDIKKQIYSTSWDGSVVIRATTAGTYRVFTDD